MFEDHLVGPEALGRPSPWDDQAVVVGRIDVLQRDVDREIVAPLLEVRLVAAEVVDRRLHRPAIAALGTGRVDLVAHHLEGLVRYLGLVVLDEVADDHQEFRAHGITCHGARPALGSERE